MIKRYVQVRPVTWEDRTQSALRRALAGDEVVAWGVYVTDISGKPMLDLDFPSRDAAVADARQQAALRGLPLYVDEIDGTTTEFQS